MGEKGMEEGRIEETIIKGVLALPLKIIPTDGGPVLRMLRPESPLMPNFCDTVGEIYFSEVYHGKVKAWKCHKRQMQTFAVPMGKIRIVLYDDREHSVSRGALLDMELGRPDAYRLLRIPPGVWYGFQGISAESALICNCVDLPHDPAEGMRKGADDESIPYQWPSMQGSMP